MEDEYTREWALDLLGVVGRNPLKNFTVTPMWSEGTMWATRSSSGGSLSSPIYKIMIASIAGSGHPTEASSAT